MTKNLQEIKPVTVVYIAGYGRSGSTLLDAILGNHPDIFGAGELTWLFRRAIEGDKCSCGVSLKACEFWSQVFSSVSQQLDGLTLERAAAVTLDNEAIWKRQADAELYSHLWSTTFQVISKVSGKRIIVDSSKTSRCSYHRMHQLLRSPGLALKPVHLIRDPRAVMWSSFRGSNRKLEAGHARSGTLPMMRGFAGWLFANGAFEWTKNDRDGVHELRYEDLTMDPGNSLAGLGGYLSLDFSDVLSQLGRGDQIHIGHATGGNRMRRSGKVVICPDWEWKEKLGRFGHMLSLIAKPLMVKYRYVD